MLHPTQLERLGDWKLVISASEDLRTESGTAGEVYRCLRWIDDPLQGLASEAQESGLGGVHEIDVAPKRFDSAKSIAFLFEMRVALNRENRSVEVV